MSARDKTGHSCEVATVSHIGRYRPGIRASNPWLWISAATCIRVRAGSTVVGNSSFARCFPELTNCTPSRKSSYLVRSTDRNYLDIGTYGGRDLSKKTRRLCDESVASYCGVAATHLRFQTPIAYCQEANYDYHAVQHPKDCHNG